VCVVFAGCQPAVSTPSLDAPLMSLREALPELSLAAMEWRADAYLVDAQLPLSSFGSHRPQVSAGFQSPTEDGESLLVTLHWDDSISTETIAHTIPVIQIPPIDLDKSMMDSGEAFEAAVDFAGGPSSLSGRGCSFLILERYRAEENLPVIWRLTLGDCDSSATEYIRIDATSGALLPNL